MGSGLPELILGWLGLTPVTRVEVHRAVEPFPPVGVAPSLPVELLPREESLPCALLLKFRLSSDKGLDILQQIRQELGALTSLVSVLEGAPRSSPLAHRPVSSTKVGVDVPPPPKHSRVIFDSKPEESSVGLPGSQGSLWEEEEPPHQSLCWPRGHVLWLLLWSRLS